MLHGWHWVAYVPKAPARDMRPKYGLREAKSHNQIYQSIPECALVDVMFTVSGNWPEVQHVPKGAKRVLLRYWVGSSLQGAARDP